MKFSLALFQLLILLLLKDAPLFAQFKYEYFGVEQGLSQTTARATVQDEEGFLWIGTWDGLNRFDGYSFKQYHYDPTQKNSLTGNNITSLAVDKQNKIWISFTDNTVNIFDKRKEEFTLLQFENRPFLISKNQFLVDDGRGNFWTAVDNKVFKIETASLEISVFNSFKKDDGQTLLAANQLLLFNQNKIFLVDETDGIRALEVELKIILAYRLKNDNYLLASEEGKIYEFDIATRRIHFVKNFAKSKNEQVLIYTMLEDSRRRVWIAGSVGLHFSDNYLSQKEKADFERLRFEFDKKQILGRDVVFNLFEDKSGIIWVGHWIGLFKIHPNRKNFKSVPLQKTYSEIFGNNFPITFNTMDDTTLFVGTTDGFFIYDIYKNQIEKFTSENSSLASSIIYTLHRDGKNRLWLGTRKGLALFDPRTKKIQTFSFKKENDDVNPNMIYAIAETRSGELLLGSAKGLIRFNPESKKYSVHSFVNANADGNFFLSLLIDNNILWGGTNGGGLLKINLHDMSFKRFAVEKGNLNSLSHNKVMALHKDKQKRIWAATLGGGLNLLQPDEKSFRHFNASNGLPNNSVYGIIEDDKFNLWFATNNGISKINYDTFEIVNYSSADGIVNVEHNQNAYFKSKSGKIYFGGISGIQFFDPKEITSNNVQPNVVATDFKLFNKSRQDLLRRKNIKLKYNENFFSFELAALIFDNPSENEFAYKLDGLNENWIQLRSRRTIDFSGLNPGAYSLKVKASNEDGVWSDEIVIANIEISPPFWQTFWFYSILYFAMIGTAALAIRSYIKKRYKLRIAELEKEKLILEERSKTRTKIARDLHDDLASTVSSAGLFLQSAKQMLNDNIDSAKVYLEKTSSILDEAEQSMSDIVWSVSPHYDSLDNLVMRIKLLAAEVCEANNVKLNFSAAGNFAASISEDVRRNTYLIIKEALFNSIKHSSAEAIIILPSRDADVFSIEISDNGKGFEDGKEISLGGNGLRNMKKRSEEINAALNIESEINAGTKIKLTLKLKREK